MKKAVSILCLVTIILSLVVTFVACDPQDGKLKPEIGFPSSWPENEFTSVVPKLEGGEIKYSTNFIGADQYYLAYEELPPADSFKYKDKLIEYGYEIIDYSEDENFIDYRLRNEAKKSEVYMNIPKGNWSDGTPRNQLGLTIYLNREK